MRVLITGITGFVGTHLARLLAREPDIEVFGLAHDPGPEIPAEVKIADIADLEEVRRIVETCDPEVIVHLAALASVGRSWKEPELYQRVNVLGSRHVAQAAAGRRLIFASTAEVYGDVAEIEQPIVETRAVAPRSPYAHTKAEAEELLRDHGAVVIRSFNAVGPGQLPHFVLPSFARQLATMKPGNARLQPGLLRVGNLAPRRDFLHIEDAVAGYRVAMAEGQPGEVYNLASGEALSIGEVLRRLIEIAEVDVEIECDSDLVRDDDIPLLCGDASKLRALGWMPRLGLDQALIDLWRATLAEANA